MKPRKKRRADEVAHDRKGYAAAPKTPYIGYTDETLRLLPDVGPGDMIRCDKCGQDHVLEADDDGSTLLLFYQCSGEDYVGAINGKSIVGQKPDARGKA